jgi:alkylhydroperoxidase/carboxymuconolactone decarboxylase family protein YurZ
VELTGVAAEEFEHVLRMLALQDERYIESVLACEAANVAASAMDARTRAFVRLGALIATGGSASSYMSTVEPALAAGATPDEVVGALVAVLPQIGTARVVSATQNLALALGYDVSAALEQLDVNTDD